MRKLSARTSFLIGNIEIQNTKCANKIIPDQAVRLSARDFLCAFLANHLLITGMD